MKWEIDIHMEGENQPVGFFSSDEYGIMTFQYSSASSRPLSLSLPIREKPYQDNRIRAFFANLLPEGARIENTIARYQLSESDIAGLLFYMGMDCPGAISCVPKGNGPVKTPGIFNTDYQELSKQQLRNIMFSLRDKRELRSEDYNQSPLAGIQGKIAVTKMPDGTLALPCNNSGAATTHILKVPRAGEEALVDHEKALMDIAANIFTGKVAETEILDIDGIRGLLIRRFDRNVDATSIRRIHQEDFCQALGLPRSLKYQKHGNRNRIFSARAIWNLLSKTENPAFAKRAFLQATVLNLAIGNTDNHAKNHALIYQGENPVLAPLYDITPGLLDSSVHHDFSFNIGSAQNHEELKEDDLYQLAEDIGIPVQGESNKKRVRKTAQDICIGIAGQIDYCQGPRLKQPGDMIAHCLTILRSAFALEFDIPERDMFITEGGGFQMPF